MNGGLWIAKTGLEAEEQSMAVTANNLANAGTIGFKKSSLHFSDLMYENSIGSESEEEPQKSNFDNIQIGQGVRVLETSKDFVSGFPKETKQSLDLFIEGNGLFQLEMPDGSIAYTRNGVLSIDPETRDLKSQSGYSLSPNINIPEDTKAIHINKDGKVFVVFNGEAKPQEVGQILIAKFTNSSKLKSIGNNLYNETEQSGEPIVDNPGNEGLGTILQGFLENSNVSVVNELVNMIHIQRVYEMNSNALSTCSKMMQYLTSHIS